MCKPFHSFKLTGDENSIYKKIYMDGQELNGVRRATFCFGIDEVPTAFIEFMATNIEIDDPNVEIIKVETPKATRKGDET